MCRFRFATAPARDHARVVQFGARWLVTPPLPHSPLSSSAKAEDPVRRGGCGESEFFNDGLWNTGSPGQGRAMTPNMRLVQFVQRQCASLPPAIDAGLFSSVTSTVRPR